MQANFQLDPRVGRNLPNGEKGFVGREGAFQAKGMIKGMMVKSDGLGNVFSY